MFRMNESIIPAAVWESTADFSMTYSKVIYSGLYRDGHLMCISACLSLTDTMPTWTALLTVRDSFIGF